MRVAMYYNNRDVRIEEMQSPHIGTGELLVKVRASGICGSDVMEWYRIKKPRWFWGMKSQERSLQLVKALNVLRWVTG